MATDKNIPEIRFKGFEGVWDKKDFNTFCWFQEGPGLRYWQFTSQGIKVINVTNLEDGFLNLNRTDRHISLNEFHKMYEHFEIQENDIVVASSGNSYGKVSVVRKCDLPLMMNTSVIRFKPLSGLDYDYLHTFLKSWYFKDQIDLLITGGAQPNFGPVHLNKIHFNLPPILSEQTQIGTYFQNLDNLISLHQRKYDKLLTVKKAMLEKMFPKEGADVPEIRFKGFEGKWEKRKFSETFMNISNNTLSRANLNYDYGKAKNIHYGDVLIKFGELLDVEKDEIPFITDDLIVGKLMSSKLQNGDIIIADAAEDFTVGKCTELLNVSNEIVLSGLHTIPVRPLISFATGYLGYFLNSSLYHNQLIRLIQGSKVSSISKTAIKDTNVFYPNDFEEQTKIGTFFQNLDTLITQHQKELEKLKNLKKACLEKMFV